MPATLPTTSETSDTSRQVIDSAGDCPAFDSLVTAQRRTVFAVCLRVLGDYQAAEDATQETFIAAWRWQGRARERGAPWLVHVALNKCRDELRRRARRPATQRIETEALVERLTSPAPGPEALTLSHDVQETLRCALDRLPPEQRACLKLVDIEGLSYGEVALLTGVSNGTVKSRIHRARMALRVLLGAAP